MHQKHARKKFETQKSKTHLILAGEKVNCKFCKSVSYSTDEEAHLQSFECIINLLKCNIFDVNESSYKIHSNSDEHSTKTG